jgi:hypothetical protein
MTRKQPGRKGFDLDYNEISKEYLDGITLKNLASKYDISQWTLLARFKKLGIKKHTTRSFNKKAFSNFNNESCYWAGFLAADGCVRKYQCSVELSHVDIEHLNKLKSFLNSNADIYKRTRKSTCVSVCFNSIDFVNDLKDNFNIIPNKSLILQPPDKMPEIFIRHFIRGYIDGDGCIGWHKYNNRPRVDICSGSKEILTWILENIQKSVNNVGNPSVRRKGEGNCYSLEFMGNQVYHILNWIYFETNSQLRLSRKYKRFIKYKNIQEC